jgi:hypothetical protein
MLKNVQTLRFFAAFWVVLHHMSPPVTPFTLTILPEAVTRLGFAGVDLFFVIWPNLHWLVAIFLCLPHRCMAFPKYQASDKPVGIFLPVASGFNALPSPHYLDAEF